jgi:hypothetical protein
MFEPLALWIGKNPVVAAAVVAGATSVIVTLVTQWLQPWQQQRLERMKAELQKTGDDQRFLLQQRIEELKSQLDERRSADAARRDYEYDARKRLYDEVEPIRFRVYEALEEAHYRVRSLARTARLGHLGSGPDSWIRDIGYYLRSTAFKLLGPVVQFRLLQRRMTFIDFSVDQHVALQYSLLKLYVRSFTDDFDFAALSPRLHYEPNDADSRSKLAGNPAVYARQAFVLGDLECVADLLIVHEDGNARALQFGEFERLLAQKEIDENLQEAMRLLVSFSPQRKPVLARLLVAQACIAELILSTYRSPLAPSDLTERLESVLSNQDLRGAVAWTDGEPIDLAFVRDYWVPRLKHLDGAAVLGRF